MAINLDDLKKRVQGMTQNEANDFFLSVITKLVRDLGDVNDKVAVFVKLIESHEHRLASVERRVEALEATQSKVKFDA
ncbi:hypothetical protein [Granulicella sp. dw_53]|uniref:hypothetical protein n=1 Tax=Granulicella sp. dw_53 TaxID=2719792 RepID=UPI001BD52CAA|nr:hypothetical protein [Granulicella sp. dw_53]